MKKGLTLKVAYQFVIRVLFAYKPVAYKKISVLRYVNNCRNEELCALIGKHLVQGIVYQTGRGVENAF